MCTIRETDDVRHSPADPVLPPCRTPPALPFDFIEFGVVVSRAYHRDILARRLRVAISEELFESPYPALVTESGLKIDWLHLDAARFFCMPVPEGHEVHHKDLNIRNARRENLEVRTAEGHRALHRLEKMKRTEKKSDTGQLWRPHAAGGLRPVPEDVWNALEKKREEESRLSKKELRALSLDLEKTYLRQALEASYVHYQELAWPHGSRTRIPPRDRTKSILDRDVKKDGVFPFRRACSTAEATYVYLISLHRLGKHSFDMGKALEDLNSRLPKGIPKIRQAVFEKMRRSPPVDQAIKAFCKYQRLPQARPHWNAVKVKIRKAHERHEERPSFELEEQLRAEADVAQHGSEQPLWRMLERLGRAGRLWTDPTWPGEE